MKNKRSCFRPAIDALKGYTPGEQPKMANLLKLNTNENAFPPSPAVGEALRTFDYQQLRRYPDPMADTLCEAIAARHNVSRNMVVAGNGSDDILTMVFRSFTSPELAVAVLDPSYSLYSVLAAMQEAPVRKIALQEAADFALPDNLLEQAQGANLLIITRPNAPTGNSFPLEAMRKIVAEFEGVVLFDEAYADFAEDNCMAFTREFSNVIVCRTSSKSFSLAGLRFGYAVGNPKLIEGMLKLKDSYNLDMLSQCLATAAIRDTAYMRQNVEKIVTERARLTQSLQQLKFRVIPSHSNFVFAAPPDGDGEKAFRMLREQAIIVRYFPGSVTGKYLRITVGTPEQDDRLLATLRSFYQN